MNDVLLASFAWSYAYETRLYGWLLFSLKAFHFVRLAQCTTPNVDKCLSQDPLEGQNGLHEYKLGARCCSGSF